MGMYALISRKLAQTRLKIENLKIRENELIVLREKYRIEEREYSRKYYTKSKRKGVERNENNEKTPTGKKLADKLFTNKGFLDEMEDHFKKLINPQDETDEANFLWNSGKFANKGLLVDFDTASYKKRRQKKVE